MAADDKDAVDRLSKLFQYLVFNITITFFLGAIFYADPFHFWDHALSELGTTITLKGTPNLASCMTVTLGLFINGRLLLEIARIYRETPALPHPGIKSGLMYLASLGSFISIIPNNLFHTIHSVGSAFHIGSVFFFDLLLLIEGLSAQKSLMIYLMIGTLSVSVFSYAIPYFLGLPIKQATQKICVINLLLIILLGAPQRSELASSIPTQHPT